MNVAEVLKRIFGGGGHDQHTQMKSVDFNKGSFGYLSHDHTNLMKGIGMLAIMFHNYFHWVAPSTGENEFDFGIERLLNLGSGIVNHPFELVNYLFSFFGHYGVQLFIFISGYGLAMAYRDKGVAYLDFVGKRLRKLYPVFILAVVFLFVLDFYRINGFHQYEWFRAIGFKLLFVSNFIPGELFSINGPWWFYGLIFQLYLIFPLLRSLYYKYGHFGLLLPMVLSYVLLYFINPMVTPADVNLMGGFLGHLPEFALGMWLAYNPKVVIKWPLYVVAALLFILGNVIPFFWQFTFLSLTLLLVGLVKHVAAISNVDGKKYIFVVGIGQLSMYIFAVYGFLHDPFIHLAAKINAPLATLILSLAFFFVSILVARAMRIVHMEMKPIPIPVFLSRVVQWLSRGFAKHSNTIKTSWLEYFILFLLLLVVVRTWDFVAGSYSGLRGQTGFYYFYLQFLLSDLVIALKVGAVWFALFWMLSIGSKRLASVFSSVLLMLYMVLSFGLVAYYQQARYPLDQSLFYYSASEIFTIAGTASNVTFFDYLPLALIVLGAIFAFRFKLKRSFDLFANAVILVGLLFLVGGVKSLPETTKFQNDSDFLVSVNKANYFLIRSFDYFSKPNQKPAGEDKFELAVRKFKVIRPSFDGELARFPFWHRSQYDNVLSEYFVKPDRKPNIVLIVVESLGFEITGPNAKYGSFTPFLDSLSQKSLYWPNCLSTSQRTFGVLPAILGSLPYGDKGFLAMREQMPSHFSLLTELADNDYFTTFNYGGYPEFQDMAPFLLRNRIDFILPDPLKADTTLPKALYNEWGFHDHVLFSRSVDTLSKMNIANPRFDIYLTLSMHGPFNFQKITAYENRAKVLVKKLSAEKQKNIESLIPYAASVLYTDNAIRDYFNRIKGTPEFENTIFIITGDHSTGWFPGTSPIDKYHVPLIIYSPLISKPAQFPAAVSHLDIVPSLLSYLSHSCGLNIRSSCHWLGAGLTVGNNSESHLSLPFMLNNREVKEYISGDLYIDHDDLYSVGPNLVLTKVTDKPKELEALKEQLTAFNTLSSYVCETNSLIPTEVVESEVASQVLIDEKIDYESTAPDLPYQSMLSAEKASSGQTSLKMGASNEFGYLTANYGIVSSTKRLLISINCKVFVSIMEGQLPRIVVQVSNDDEASLYYDAQIISKPDNTLLGIGAWVDYFYYKEIDLSGITLGKNPSVKLYLWNKDKSEIFIDDLSTKVLLESD